MILCRIMMVESTQSESVLLREISNLENIIFFVEIMEFLNLLLKFSLISHDYQHGIFFFFLRPQLQHLKLPI